MRLRARKPALDALSKFADGSRQENGRHSICVRRSIPPPIVPHPARGRPRASAWQVSLGVVTSVLPWSLDSPAASADLAPGDVWPGVTIIGYQRPAISAS